MAEHMMLSRRSETGASTASAGLSAWPGAPAEPEAVAVMAEIGIDIRGHRARRFELALARGFDLILVMEHAQQRWIHDRYPVLRGRVKRLGDWLGQDVPDPLGRPLVEFRHARDLIGRAVDSWLPRLAS
jgi:protein-tyrosine phosphatase